MDEIEYEQWLAEVDAKVAEQVYGVERPEPCVHGHFDCATVERGPCANETMAREFARAVARGEVN